MFNLSMIMSPAFKAFLAHSLTEEQQVWLSEDLVKRPLGVPEFFLSQQGQIALQDLLAAYMKHSNGGQMPVLLKPKELWKKNTDTGRFERKS
jgi:hypothetical protein